MAARKKTTEVAEEVKNVVEETKDIPAEEVKEEITEETTEETTEEIKEETPGETLTNSLDKLVNAVADKINKDTTTPKPAEPQKKTFKLGFWGYLGLAVVAKATVEIVRAIADSKKPRK